MSTLVVVGRLSRPQPKQILLRLPAALGLALLGAATGWLVMSQWTLVVIAVVAAAFIAVVAAAWLGFEAFVLLLLIASMLPLPTLTVGSVGFPLATAAIPLTLVAALVICRRRGLPLSVPYIWPYVALIVVGALSVAASYVFWDPRVGTSTERGYGHRWIGYQLTGLYLLAAPLLAYAGGVLTAQVARIGRIHALVFTALAGLSLALLVMWLQHPISPLDAFAQKSRTKSDNQWAAYCVVCAIAVLFTLRRPLSRFAGSVMLMFGSAATLIAYVLSGWVGLALAVTTLIWDRFRARGLMIWFGVVALIALPLQSIIVTIVTQRTLSHDTDRLGLWLSALIVWTKSPLIGVGSGNLASYMEAYNVFPLGIVLQGYQQPHNIFLEILAETGIIGILLLGIFLVLVLRKLWRFRSEDAMHNLAAKTALGVMVTGALIAAFGSGFLPTIASAGYNALPTVFVVWFLVGCGVGVTLRSDATSQRAPALPGGVNS